MNTNYYYYLKKYTDILQAKNLAQSTIKSHERNIIQFIDWTKKINLNKIHSLNKKDLESYQIYLTKIKINNKLLNYNSRRNRLVSLRQWFAWLCKRNTLLYNPLADLEMPQKTQKIPRDVLTEEEAEKILRQPNTSTLIGLRDKAILEVLYSTGVRRRELTHLQIDSIDENRGVLYIKQGKGKKDRFIPIGERALHWLKKYINEVRPQLEEKVSYDFIFLDEYGDKINGKELDSVVKENIQKAKINKSGSCHMFRHTMATLMLEHGADLRYIQEMLGHKLIQTTQIYTKVSLTKLQSVYEKTSPSNFF